MPDRHSPATVSEAIAYLASHGYVDDYRVCPEGVVDVPSGSVHPMKTAVIDYTFRFEGPSDPADQAIVLGVTCPEWGRKGVLVSAYGPEADPEQARLLRALAAEHSPG